VELGGRRVQVTRPRVRGTDGAEVRLDSYAAFAGEDQLTAVVMEKMLAGVATRRHARTGEPVGVQVVDAAKSTSRSATSRRFVAATKTAAAERMADRAEQALLRAETAQTELLKAYAERTAAERAAGRRGACGRPPTALNDKDAVQRQRARLARTRAHLEAAAHPRLFPSYRDRASLTDPDSRTLPGKHGGYLQGYNLQISCVRRQVLLAVEVHDNPSDMNALVPMVRRSAEHCATAGLPCLIKEWQADNGYASTANFAALADRPLLVAISSGTPAGPSGPRAERPVPQGLLPDVEDEDVGVIGVEAGW
jgi:hypothetical protein